MQVGQRTGEKDEVARLAVGSEERGIAIDLHENVDGVVIRPVLELLIGHVQIVGGCFQSAVPTDGDGNGGLIAAGLNLQDICGPGGAWRGKSLVYAHKVNELGRVDGQRPILRIERAGHQDLAADFASRRIGRVNVRVVQAVGQFGYLGHSQRGGCSPQGAGPGIGDHVRQRKEHERVRAGPRRPVNVRDGEVPRQPGVADVVAQGVVGIESQRAGTNGRACGGRNFLGRVETNDK